MSQLDEIVEITITRGSTTVDTASFQIPLALVETTAFTERVRQYNSMAAVEDDFDAGDVAHTIAQKLFGQTAVGAKPPYILIGRKAAAEEWVDALAAVEDVNDTWYALVAGTHDAEEVEALSDAINARRKIFFSSTQDVTSVATSTTDIGAVLEAKNADRSVMIYLPTADTEYPEAAWVGGYLPFTPGTIDWGLKQLSGVTRSVLNDTARANLTSKNVNYYTRVAGVDVVRDGDTLGGSPIDEITVVDWIYARLQEGIYFRLINSLKVPMTNVGMTIIENEIRAVLSQAEANGAIDSGWRVVAPNVLSIPANQRAQRIAGTFTFTARLAGAVRRVIITGRLEV